MSEENPFKCVIIGDSTVGKTCLLLRYSNDTYPEEFIPTVSDTFIVSLSVNNKTSYLRLFDTAGQEDYVHLRQYAFRYADILVVCFAIDLRSSFINVQEKWIPEIKKYCPKIPFVLMGMKIDLRDADCESTVTKQEAEDLAKQLYAARYMECSALTKENVPQVFEEILIMLQSDDGLILREVYPHPASVTTEICAHSTDEKQYKCCSLQNCSII